MEVCQFNFCALFALSCVSCASRLPAEIAALGAAAAGGGEPVGPAPGAEPCGAGVPRAAVAGVEPCPKIAFLMLSKMLMVCPLSWRGTAVSCGRLIAGGTMAQ